MIERRTRRPRALLVFLATVFGLALFSSNLTMQSPTTTVIGGREIAPGEILVKFRRAHTAAERSLLHSQIGADRDEQVGGIGLTHFHSRTVDTAQLLAFFRTHPDVVYAEPNYIIRASATPNDPMFGQLWGLLNIGQPIGTTPGGIAGDDIKAVPAWDISTGSRNNVIGVVDTGIDYNHPDLAANVWSAPAAFTVFVGGHNVNCAAGTHGYNAILGNCIPLDDNDHGTHVSGTIGAVGNNSTGVTGINWTASIMGLKFLNASGSGTTAAAINAIEFAIQTKAYFSSSSGANVRILSNSWGGGGFSTALYDEIVRANTANMLFVAAAGNAASNNDIVPSYPASYDVPNVVAVASTDNTDNLSWFSNYGATSVDLAAPGSDILSTTRSNTYKIFNGTSMATPHVSGAALLILSRCSLDTTQLRNTLLANVDVVPALTFLTATGGRLNLDRAIRSCATPAVPPPPTGLVATPGDARVTLNWTGSSGATSYKIKRGTSVGGEVTIATGVSTTNYLDTSVVNGTTYYYVVTAVNAAGESGPSNEVSARPIPPPPAPAGLTATPGDARVTLSWGASTGATSYIVKRSTSSGSETPLVTGIVGTTYLDLAVTNGTTYFYVVSAVNAVGSSPNSNEASARPVPPAPPAPTGLTASPGNARVTLAWSASSGATSYTVKRGTSSGSEVTLVTGLSSPGYLDTSVSNGTTYFYVVTAVNLGGESGPSNEASATPIAPPLAPAGLTATPGDARVTLGWSASAGATSYTVKRSTSSGTEVSLATGVVGTSYLDTAVSNGTTYFYVVVAVNGSGTSPNSNEASATPVPPAPPAPSGLTATPGDARVTLGWSASAGATSYTVKRSTSSGTEVSLATGVVGTSYLDTAVSNGTTYFYVVTAVNAGGSSGPSNEASAMPVPPAPSAPAGLTATPGDARVTLGWGAVAGATSYTVLRSTSTGTEVSLATGVVGTSYLDTAVTNGITYFYVVKAVNLGGSSGPSNEASATPVAPPVAPSGLTATPGDARVTLGWTASPGATSYTIKRSTSSGTETSLATGVAGTSYLDLAVSNGTTYFYVVVAVNAGGSSGPSNEASATPNPPPPPAPAGLTATPGDTQVTLGWSASAGATSYTVKRSTLSGAETTLVTGVVGTSYLDTAVTNGTTYFYLVTAVNAGGESGASNEASATPMPVPPPAPTALTATPGNAQVSLAWNPAAGAATYTVKRSTISGAETTLATGVVGTSYLDVAVSNGTTYFYVVTAVNASGESGVSNEASATPQPPAPPAPAGLTATPGNAQVSLSWGSVGGATSYTVKRSTSSGTETSLATGVVGTSYLDTAVTNGVTYFYVVVAVNGGGSSGPSNEVSARPLPPAPPAPTGLTATPGNAQVSLSWSASAGATSYTVKRSTSSGTETSLATGIAGTSYLDTSVTNGTTYFYVVTAVNLGGESGPSNEASATPLPPAPTAPTSLTATPGDARVTLTWIAPAGAASYTVMRSTSSGSEVAIATGVIGTTYLDTTVTNGTTYFYVVTAVNLGGTSGPSNEVSATPSASSLPAPTSLTATSMFGGAYLRWGLSTKGSTYIIKRSTTSGGPYTVIATNVQGGNYVDATVTSGVTYYYVVAATRLGITSADSNQASFTAP